MGGYFFSSRRRHTRYWRDWSSDVCSSDLAEVLEGVQLALVADDGDVDVGQLDPQGPVLGDLRQAADPLEGDRKSVVSGKSVDLGGRRIIKTKNPHPYPPITFICITPRYHQ